MYVEVEQQAIQLQGDVAITYCANSGYKCIGLSLK